MTTKNNTFPYVDSTASSTKWCKSKFPCRITDQGNISKYQQDGHEVLCLSDMLEGFRFNMATITLKRPDTGKAYTNKITLSKPSAEVMCVRKVVEKWQICLVLQPRTPYQVEVAGKKFARFFFEQPAGLVENGESFEDTALREAEEETGYKVVHLQRLVAPVICRHVSYADESSVVFFAVLGSFDEQHLDENEDIKVNWFNAEDVENELEDYLEGRKPNFFGFDVPDMTILALQRFFVKLHRGEISM